MRRPIGDEVEPAGSGESELRVDSADATEAAQEFPIGEERSNVRLGEEVVARSADGELRRLTECLIGAVVPSAWRLIVCHEHTERRPSDLPGQLTADSWVDDGSRVDQVDRRGELKNLSSFEKEWSQLIEEEREPLVDLYLRTVRLDLREVGIDREIGRKIRGDAVLCLLYTSPSPRD